MDGDHLHAGNAARRQPVAQLAKIRRPIGLAHRLEHFNGGDAVVVAGLVAVILQFQRDFFVQSGLENPFLGKIELRLADRQASDLAANVARRKFGKAAPAAADFKHVIVRAKANVSGKGGIFGALAAFQVSVGTQEQRRGIGHARIQPGGVKRIAKIVMGVDVAFRAGFGVAVQPVRNHLQEAHDWLALKQSGDHRLVGAKQFQKSRQIRAFPFATQIGFGNADIAAARQPPCKRHVMHDHAGFWPVVASKKMEMLAIRHQDIKLAFFQHSGKGKSLAHGKWIVPDGLRNLVGADQS